MPINKRTEDGNRPDLAAIPVNRPENYIGMTIFPMLKVREKAGKIYYTAVMSDSSAETDRDVGASLSSTYLAASNLDYSVGKYEKRYACPWDEVEQMGGIEATDALGAKGSKRSVMRAIEDAHAAVVFDGTSYSGASDVSSAILAGISNAATSLKQVKGKTALVISNYLFNQMIQAPEVKNLMFRSFAGLTPQQVLSLDKDAFVTCMQGLYPVDMILIGDDDHWKLSGKEDAFALVKLADPDETSHKLDAIYGKTIVYYGKDNPEEPFELSSYPENDNHCNCYDAVSYADIEEFNSTGKVVLTFSLATAKTTGTTATTAATTAATTGA